MQGIKPNQGGYTGSGDMHSIGQMLWRAFFLAELAVAAAVVFGFWSAIGGSLSDLWPGAMFCYAVVLAVILDAAVKHVVLHRRPLLSPVFAVITCIFFLAAGIGLSWLMAGHS